MSVTVITVVIVNVNSVCILCIVRKEQYNEPRSLGEVFLWVKSGRQNRNWPRRHSRIFQTTGKNYTKTQDTETSRSQGHWKLGIEGVCRGCAEDRPLGPEERQGTISAYFLFLGRQCAKGKEPRGGWGRPQQLAWDGEWAQEPLGRASWGGRPEFVGYRVRRGCWWKVGSQR